MVTRPARSMGLTWRGPKKEEALPWQGLGSENKWTKAMTYFIVQYFASCKITSKLKWKVLYIPCKENLAFGHGPNNLCTEVDHSAWFHWSIPRNKHSIELQYIQFGKWNEPLKQFQCVYNFLFSAVCSRRLACGAAGRVKILDILAVWLSAMHARAYSRCENENLSSVMDL